MGVEGEADRDQHVETRLGGFAGGGGEINAGEGAELRPDEDRGAALGLALHEAAFRADVSAPGIGSETDKLDPVGAIGLMDASRFQMLDYHRGEIGFGR